LRRILNISDMVRSHARLRPQAVGTLDSRRSLTFKEWDHRASGLAKGLMAQGLQVGERVAVLAFNSIEWMEIYVALARAGLVAVPLNFRLTAPELLYIMQDAQVTAVIAGHDLQPHTEEVRHQLPLKACVVFGGPPTSGWLAYEEVVNTAYTDKDWPDVSPQSLCALMYTSGTTGKPKGALRSHEASTLVAYATAMEMGFTREDKGLLVMPLCHANSLYFANTFIHLGACVVVDDSSSFKPESLLKNLAQHQITFTSLVPTHYIMVLGLTTEVKARYALASVARLLISSAPASERLKRDIMALFENGSLYELYGSTEAGWVTLLRPEDQITKLGSVGREWAGSGPIKLLDDNRQEVPDGEVGELFSCTPYAFEGYWQSSQKTAEAFAGAWVSVGDMAKRDADGYIWLIDRKSNMIISGGENVYPSEVENVLASHPDVQEVAVVGVPHPKWGESVLAAVVLKEGASATSEVLQDFCSSRLAGYKRPRQFVFLQTQDLPRTATGKIVHRHLRQKFIDAFEPAEVT
jgi:acyl-CoA synthetase (AMP-forming)/AMP-acid ligase II